MANDEDLHRGLLNLEEILHRLDARAKNLELQKAHAPQPAPGSAGIKHEAPPPLNLPAQQAAPVVIAPAEAVPTPVAAATVTPIAAPPFAQTPIKAPAPAVKALEPVKNPEKAAPPTLEIKPVIPAKKPFALHAHTLFFFCLGLGIAGGAYQLTFNSAKARYTQAGELVKTARLAEAISAYTKIIARHAGSPEAAYSQYAIGEIKAMQGDNSGAIERYEQFLLAAPAGDAKVAQAKFKIAEIEFKQANFPDAEFMYQNADIRASIYAKQAEDRVSQIKTVKTQIAGARKLIGKDPAKAVEALAAVLAAYPGVKEAAAGLEEARKALTAANASQAARTAAREARAAAKAARAHTPSAPKPALHKAASAAGNAAVYSKERLNACNAVWMIEKIQGQLDAEMTAAGKNNNCEALRENMAACKGLQEEYESIQNLKPETRALIEEGTNPDWTAVKQAEQDTKTLKAYGERRCGELMPVLTR